MLISDGGEVGLAEHVKTKQHHSQSSSIDIQLFDNI